MNSKPKSRATTMPEDKINLLIVDDEPDFLDAIGKRLSVRGFNIFTVDGGEKALDCAGNNPIDVALVDLKMPGVDGASTLKQFKKRFPWMEIIILTGHGTVSDAMRCLENGAYSFIEKPCEMNKIIEVVEKDKWIAIITSDHGNSDQLVDPDTGKSHTAHTAHPTPIVVIDPEKRAKELKPGSLCDVAPTLLDLLEIQKPKEMTGVSLLK